MKTYLGLIAAVALTLTACGGGESKPAESTPPAPSTPAVASVPATPEPASAATSEPVVASAVETSTPAAAGECSAIINSNDAMQFDVKEIAIKSSCQQYTITLKHTGQMKKEAMGHNIVISKAADKDAVVSDGVKANVESGYVKPNDERIVAQTNLIGGGEETSVTFDVAKLAKGEAYEYFCTFPGHATQMSGKITIVE